MHTAASARSQQRWMSGPRQKEPSNSILTARQIAGEFELCAETTVVVFLKFTRGMKWLCAGQESDVSDIRRKAIGFRGGFQKKMGQSAALCAISAAIRTATCRVP